MEQNHFIGHYGHPKLPDEKHRLFLLLKDKGYDAFWISGSTTTYEYKDKDRSVNPGKSKMFLGKVPVGRLSQEW